MYLPVDDLRAPLLEAVADCGRVVVRAPTGSGKSTRIPPMLAASGMAGDGQVVVLQPRRLAARMLAARVAREAGCELGEHVGYQIRLDNRSGPRTRILYVTEGILLRRMIDDPELRGIGAVVFDEFHERHLFGDITLARALDLQEQRRPDLKVLVMSATLEGIPLEKYLEPCRALESSGRTHPVEIEHTRTDPTDEPVWETAARAVARAFPVAGGHALVFMPGAYEIAKTVQALRSHLEGNTPVLPLHGELPPAEQDRAVESGGEARVIVSTNVAETSLTIEGVTLVVDSGLARIPRYDPHRGIDTLLIEKISRASADQRAGRAGRTAPGKCLRLWSERDHARRPAHETPEVRRLDLAEVVLTLKAAGVEDLAAFRWIEPPEQAALARAAELLTDLGALDADGAITSTGRRMLSFPVHPRYARMFVEAGRLGCVRAAAMIAALSQSRNILLRADRRIEAERADLFGGGRSDFSVLLRAQAWAARQDFRPSACRRLAVHADSARQVAKLHQQFLDIAADRGLPVEDAPADDEAIAKCVLAGFADHVARRRGAGTLLCDVVHGRRAMLARNSVARDSRLVVAAEIAEIGSSDGGVKTTLSLVTEIEEAWLRELFPGNFSETRGVCFDSGANRVVERSEKKFRDLVLESIDREAKPSAAASACLAAEIVRGDLPLPGWNEQADQFVHRVNCLAQWMPDAGIRPIGEAERELIVAEICDGALSHREVKDRSVLPHLEKWLGAEQRRTLDRFAPARVPLPGGREAKLVYSGNGEPPVLRARIQEIYELREAPAVAAGRVRVTMEILAPNHRPIQRTQDLASFWKDAYPGIKPQLQRRYPKHEWR